MQSPHPQIALNRAVYSDHKKEEDSLTLKTLARAYFTTLFFFCKPTVCWDQLIPNGLRPDSVATQGTNHFANLQFGQPSDAHELD